MSNRSDFEIKIAIERHHLEAVGFNAVQIDDDTMQDIDDALIGDFYEFDFYRHLKFLAGEIFELQQHGDEA